MYPAERLLIYICCKTISCKGYGLRFDCGNDTCIDYQYRCNGIIDCRNASDEQDCGRNK